MRARATVLSERRRADTRCVTLRVRKRQDMPALRLREGAERANRVRRCTCAGICQPPKWKMSHHAVCRALCMLARTYPLSERKWSGHTATAIGT
jgi:hypothetical protein